MTNYDTSIYDRLPIHIPIVAVTANAFEEDRKLAWRPA